MRRHLSRRTTYSITQVVSQYALQRDVVFALSRYCVFVCVCVCIIYSFCVVCIVC